MISREEYDRLDSIASELQDTCHKQAQRIAELEANYANRTQQLSEVNLHRRQLEARVKELRAKVRELKEGLK